MGKSSGGSTSLYNDVLPVWRIWLAPLSLAICGVMSGCGGHDRPELGTVTGVVTFENQPLPQASVVFEPEQGKDSRAVTDQQGRYELVYLRDIKGAVVGPHTVRITTATEVNPQEKVPARYHAQSELRVDVRSGANTFDFELKP